MKVRALSIHLGARRVGALFQYPLSHDQVIHRFVADDSFALDPGQSVLSLSLRANSPQQQEALWRNLCAGGLNGSRSKRSNGGWLLPPFFQNLLPEGPLREQIAQMRGCGVNDHFELLAATGKDLPGDVTARPMSPDDLSREVLQRLITQNNDAIEMSVVGAPIEDAISVSGVQPKLTLLRDGDRFVARTKISDQSSSSTLRHLIAKLPTPSHPYLPELEDLSLRMAKAAGVRVVEAELVDMRRVGGDFSSAESKFLAVYRYDRDADTPTGRVHCEDFAQILGVQPEDKYSGDYLTVAAVLMSSPSLGEKAVHELLRRILVNEMMGNPDMHLKNIGLIYLDGVTPELPPAYDMVAYSAYGFRPRGRALKLWPDAPVGPQASVQNGGKNASSMPQTHHRLTPRLVREFCHRLGLPERPAWNALKHCAERAAQHWPHMIEASGISAGMKENILRQMSDHLGPQRLGSILEASQVNESVDLQNALRPRLR
jgi:serine/threonine-protein kinase HipA